MSTTHVVDKKKVAAPFLFYKYRTVDRALTNTHNKRSTNRSRMSKNKNEAVVEKEDRFENVEEPKQTVSEREEYLRMTPRTVLKDQKQIGEPAEEADRFVG